MPKNAFQERYNHQLRKNCLVPAIALGIGLAGCATLGLLGVGLDSGVLTLDGFRLSNFGISPETARTIKLLAIPAVALISTYLINRARQPVMKFEVDWTGYGANSGSDFPIPAFSEDNRPARVVGVSHCYDPNTHCTYDVIIGKTLSPIRLHGQPQDYVVDLLEITNYRNPNGEPISREDYAGFAERTEMWANQAVKVIAKADKKHQDWENKFHDGIQRYGED